MGERLEGERDREGEGLIDLGLLALFVLLVAWGGFGGIGRVP